MAIERSSSGAGGEGAGRAGGAARAALRFTIKAALTVGAFYLLFAHQVTDAEGKRATTLAVIRDFLPQIDAGVFFRFVFLAAGIKLVGILASMLRWRVLLLGQGIDLPFRHVFGSFLIGRFLGTFLPSTLGLDGYKLYDAARFSGRSIEASGATLVEKVLGFTGIFITYLVALPFGVSIFGDKAEHVALLTVPIALAPIAACFAIFVWPGPPLLRWLAARIPGDAQPGFLARLVAAVTAYRARPGIVAAAAALSFVVHFTTAAMYFFTALAIGVTAAEASFWQVTFASTIQILATVLSPFTIAGEGIREIAQYYLLSHLMGPAESIVSAALGFWAAEALTLFGGVIWWARRDDYVPRYCRVDGRQVDYAAAALAARDLGLASHGAATATGAGATARLPERIVAGVVAGAAGGVLAGALLGAAEAAIAYRLAGPGEEMQVLWYAIALYGIVLTPIGAGVGGVLAMLPLSRAAIARWVTPLAFVAAFLPLGLAVALFRLQRDAYAEQRPPLGVALATALAALALTVMVAAVLARRRRAAVDDAGLRGPGRRLAAGLGTWLGAMAIGAVLAATLGPPAPGPPAVRASIPDALRSKPNLILVIIDTLRADHLGIYGDARGLTPNLDALAREGAAFRGFAQASWTKPSIATILTSLYASSHGAMSKTALLPDSAVTVAEALEAAGYTTAGFVSNINLAPSFNFQQGFGEYTYLPPDYLFGAEESSSKLVLYNLVRKVWFTVNKKRVVTQYYQDSRTVNAHALPWLERHRDDRFFLLLHYMDPHDPYFRHPYDGEAIARVENQNPAPALAPRMRELYAGEVKYVDESVGELAAALRRDGLWDDTAIIVTADHGEEFQEHGGWWHGTTLYGEEIDVPLVVKGPRSAARPPAPGDGTRVRLLDVAPTLLAFAGVEAPGSWQGVDLRQPVPADRALFAEEDHEGNVLSAVQRQGRKLIRANPGNPRGLAPTELYDVATDPRERANLAAAEPREVARLEGVLGEMATAAAGQAVASSGDVKMDDATRERLRALGYVQ
ncbi:MAG TPA: sulfatase-like hydrolase/transferase [Candidatus Binatia bacterium]|nr:sulfatase-like hydrolase/transferase [Candidatus Binatia bacterium]